MEKTTRKEKYAKYRKEIRNTPDNKFPNNNSKIVLDSDRVSLDLADHATFSIKYSDSFAALRDIASSSKNDEESPFQAYLHKKKLVLWIKIICFIVTVAAMVAWFYLLSHRG